MSNPLTFVEVEGQHVEVLPDRIVLSRIDVVDLGGGDARPVGCDGGKNYASNVNTPVYQNADGCSVTATGKDGFAANAFRGR